jgi:hypothetical protein
MAKTTLFFGVNVANFRKGFAVILFHQYLCQKLHIGRELLSKGNLHHQA